MLHLFLPVLLFLPGKENKIEFGKLAGRTVNWTILSDNVMGGMSDAIIEYGNTSLLLKGNVSLENRGGFVSVKSGWDKRDLSSYKMVNVTFRSAGQRFAFTLENSGRWWEPAYKHEFGAKEENNWQTISLKLDEFKEEVIGRPTGNTATTSILQNILRIGISTNEKSEGPFWLEIESIEFL